MKVVIFTGVKDKRYIILFPEDVDIEPFLLSLTQDISLLKSDTNSSRENAVFVRRILNLLETEWDQKCACALLALNRSRTQLEDLTVDPATVTKISDHVAKVLDEIDNARIASNDILRLRLKVKEENVESNCLKSSFCMKEKMKGGPTQNSLNCKQRSVT